MSVHVGNNNVVVMDPEFYIYARLFRPGSGPDRHIKGKAEDVARLARELCPKRSGVLANSIRADQTREASGRFSFGYAVSANTRYAAAVHEGAAPHFMATAGYMKFQGTNAFFGQRIRTHTVNHPGNAAQPFLQDALVAMVG